MTDHGPIIVAKSMLEAEPGAISAHAYRGAIEGLLRYINAQPDLLTALQAIDAMPYYAAPLQDYAVDSLLKRYTRALDLARDAIAAAKSNGSGFPEGWDRDESKAGTIFEYHACSGCQDGARKCKEGNPNCCSWPRARND